jgi:Zn finger protein HypA/HybF involved in hydrogenase expression
MTTDDWLKSLQDEFLRKVEKDRMRAENLRNSIGDPEHFYLPCPFCGSSDHLVIEGDGSARFVGCSECDAVGPWIEELTNAESICVEVWNIRGTIPQRILEMLCLMNNHQMPEKDKVVAGHAPCPGCGFIGLEIDAEDEDPDDKDEPIHIWVTCARCSAWSVSSRMEEKESVEDVLKRWDKRA